MTRTTNAVQFHGNFDEIERFVGGDAEFRGGALVVATPDGPLRVAPGEWVVRCDDGRFTASPTPPGENGCGNG